MTAARMGSTPWSFATRPAWNGRWNTSRRLPGEVGPVCQALEVSGTAHGHPLVRQTIRLYDGIKHVEFSTRLLKDVTPLLEGYLAFPFKVAQPAFRYEGVLAALEPVADFLPGGQSDALAVQNWVKVQGEDITVLWSPLDAPLVSLGGLRHAYVSPAHRNQVTDDIYRRRRLVTSRLRERLDFLEYPL